MRKGWFIAAAVLAAIAAIGFPELEAIVDPMPLAWGCFFVGLAVSGRDL